MLKFSIAAEKGSIHKRGWGTLIVFILRTFSLFISGESFDCLLYPPQTVFLGGGGVVYCFDIALLSVCPLCFGPCEGIQ